MPVKRRAGKRREDVPYAVDRLLRNLPIENTPENRDVIIAIRFFGDFPELNEDIRLRAQDVLDAWRSGS